MPTSTRSPTWPWRSAWTASSDRTGVRAALDEASPRRRVPLLVKIAPDLADADIDAVADLALEIGLDGIIRSDRGTRGARRGGPPAPGPPAGEDRARPGRCRHRRGRRPGPGDRPGRHHQIGPGYARRSTRRPPGAGSPCW